MDWISIALLFAAAAGHKAPLASKPRTASFVLPQAGASLTVTATPAVISFNAADPDTPAAGSSPAVVRWDGDGQKHNIWTVTVQASSPSFTNCPSVPVSVVTMSCSQVTVSKGGSGTCSSPVALSTSPQVIATGGESSANATYQVNLNISYTDSWKSNAQLSPQCALTLTYSVNLP